MKSIQKWIVIDSPLQKRVKVAAKKNGQSLRQTVETALREYLKHN